MPSHSGLRCRHSCYAPDRGVPSLCWCRRSGRDPCSSPSMVVVERDRWMMSKRLTSVGGVPSDALTGVSRNDWHVGHVRMKDARSVCMFCQYAVLRSRNCERFVSACASLCAAAMNRGRSLLGTMTTVFVGSCSSRARSRPPSGRRRWCCRLCRRCRRRCLEVRLLCCYYCCSVVVAVRGLGRGPSWCWSSDFKRSISDDLTYSFVSSSSSCCRTLLVMLLVMFFNCLVSMTLEFGL